MLYDDSDKLKIKRLLTRNVIIWVLILAITTATGIMLLLWREHLYFVLSMIALSTFALFYFKAIITPYIAYYRFSQHMYTGQIRKDEFYFNKCGDTSRIGELEMLRVDLFKEDWTPTFLYLDTQKKWPEMEHSQKMELTYFDRYVIGIRLL